MAEMTGRCLNDAGPVCGCDEKYKIIQNYKPFIPGGINPYRRRQMPDEPLEVSWKLRKIGWECLAPEEAIAKTPSDLPRNTGLSGREYMFIQQQHYTDQYLARKLQQCDREHSEDCNCPNK